MELALEAGAEDVINNQDHFEVRCPLAEFDNLSTALDQKGIVPDSAELAYLPNSLTPLTDKDTAQKFLRLVDFLEDLDDVQNVYDNSDIDDSLLPED